MEVILIYCERSIPAKSVLTKPEIFLLSPPQIGFQEIVTEEKSPGIQSRYLLSKILLLPLSFLQFYYPSNFCHSCVLTGFLFSFFHFLLYEVQLVWIGMERMYSNVMCNLFKNQSKELFCSCKS